MTNVSEIVESVRSKNAGPFWLTIDIFCGNSTAFKQVCKYLETQKIGNVFNLSINEIQRFEMPQLNVIKFSLPRPHVQGSLNDSDMHGATWAALIYEITLY
mgnify:FL=1